VTRRTGYIDLVVFLSVLALMVFSIGVVFSASVAISGAKFGDAGHLFRSHTIRVVLGVAALFAGMFVDYHAYRNVSKILLLVGIALLAYTLVGGMEVKGAQRWVSFGPSRFQLQFQPSEFAKYALVIHLAVLLAQKRKYVTDLKRGYLPLLLWIAAVAGLVLLQPNFSTAVIILAISFTLLYIGRVRLLHMLGTVAAVLPLVAAYAVSAPYRTARILAFFTDTQDLSARAEAARYQITQSLIALGSGGLFGVGMGMSKQRELFLPESYTDFIFAIVGEEYGLLGSLLVLAIFIVILIRGMKIAKHATDDLGRYLAAGITIVITTYALVNVMVTTGMVPTTGLPMPLLSYGGTSILFTAYAFGILLNISMFTRIRPRAVEAPPAPPPGVTAGELFQ
jgi:cell division protein FtsW